MIAITVKDTGTQAIREGTRLNGLHEVMGRAVTNVVMAHFYRLNAERENKLGGKRTNFYSKAAKSTSYKVFDNGAMVSVAKLGIRQRLEGGTILPKKKYLTIPVVAEAYGRRAREFSNLVVGRDEHGRLALVEAESVTIKKSRKKKDKGKLVAGEKRGGKVMYLLVPKVVQRADPTVLPTLDAMVAAAILAGNEYAARRGKGKA